MKDDEPKPQISLKTAEQSDAGDLFRWRNDPVIRQNSFADAPISYDDHVRWFREKLSRKDCTIYIASCGDVKIGSIRFEERENVIKVSVMVDPQLRGRGLGSEIIRLGTEKFMKENNPDKQIVAEIKRDNIASLKAFQKAGFQERFVTCVFDRDGIDDEESY